MTVPQFDVQVLDPRRPGSRETIDRAWEAVRDPRAPNLLARHVDLLWRNIDFLSPPDRALRIGLLSTGGSPRALAAFERYSTKIGPVRLRALGFLNPTVLPPGGSTFVAPGDLEAWEALGRFVASGRMRWSCFSLAGTETGGALAMAVRTAVGRTGLVLERAPAPQYFVDLGGRPDDYMAGFGRNLRKSVRRGRDRLAAMGKVAYVDCTSDLRTGFADLEAVDRASWRHADAAVAAINEDIWRFCRSLYDLDPDPANHMVRLMTLNGKAVAGHYSYRMGDTLFAIKNCFDEAHSACSPGTLMLLDVILEACRAGIRRVEFNARNAYLERLATGTRWLERDILFNRRNEGLIFGQACRVMLALRRRRTQGVAGASDDAAATSGSGGSGLADDRPTRPVSP